MRQLKAHDRSSGAVATDWMPSWEITEHPLIAMAKIIDMNSIKNPGGEIFTWSLTVLTTTGMSESHTLIIVLVNVFIMTLINSMSRLDRFCPKKTCQSRGM